MIAPPRRPRIWRALPLGLLVLCALWSLSVQWREVANTPTREEWDLAQAIVREGFLPGDIVRTAPIWSDDARVGLFDLPFDMTTELEDEELYLYDRLWILADSEHLGDAEESLPPGYTKVQTWAPSERTNVMLVDIPPPDAVLFDVLRSLPEAEVFRDRDGQIEACDNWTNDAFYCGPVNDFLKVTASYQETGGSLHHCVFVGLQPDGVDLHIRFEDVVLGSHLRGHYGNTMPSVRADRGSDIRFRVELDGTTRVSETVGKWDQAFHTFDIDTAASAGPGHRLDFVIHADDFYDRWFCFRGRALR